jgi:hypothetical protein
MKNVKFTLGFLLSALFLGAFLNDAKAQFPEDQGLDIYVIDTVAEVTAKLLYIEYDTQKTVGTPVTLTINTPSVKDLKGESFTGVELNDIYYNGDLKSTSPAVYYGTPGGKNLRLYAEITVTLPYAGGKETIPWVKQKLNTTGINGVILTPFSKQVKRGDWTFGTGEAVYTYLVPIFPLVINYAANEIIFDISTGEVMADSNGGNANPVILRSVSFETEGAVTVVDLLGENISTDEPIFVPTKSNYTFNVESTTEPTVRATQKNPDAVGAFDYEIESKGLPEGTYQVTVKAITADAKIKVTSSVTESGGTGNQTLAVDAVWSASGVLNVKAASPGVLSVYSITGQLTTEISVSGDATLPLSKGLYIVKLNGKAYKVVL